MSRLRGADVIARSLAIAGVRRVFTVSGNQIMSIFDACLDTNIKLIHTRHEAAAVHMADAWGRLTDEIGVALLTAGPGHANGLAALYTAMANEAPMVCLSGHAATDQLGHGAFQEMPQADMAAYVTKASWTATQASELGQELARAARIARSGRPGPVHISLPVDVLESRIDNRDAVPRAEDFHTKQALLDGHQVEALLTHIRQAQRPLILTGPTAMRGPAVERVRELAMMTQVPIVGMESPRGVFDPSLGAFTDVLAGADLIVLLAKSLDYTVKFGAAPVVDPGCRFICVEPQPELLDQTALQWIDENRLMDTYRADVLPALDGLLVAARHLRWSANDWFDEVYSAVEYRPPAWTSLRSPQQGPLNAVTVCQSLQPILDRHGNSILVADGGEFGQWAQSCLSATQRLINGIAGSIGSALPYAVAARLAMPESPILVVLGDGSFGFHMAEFDTAVRYQLPFVAVVGNDACWNAERQAQLRAYGPDRAVGCELNPSRYDQVVEALGGHGENVSAPAQLEPALRRALKSGKPACVNVLIAGEPAPVLRR